MDVTFGKQLYYKSQYEYILVLNKNIYFLETLKEINKRRTYLY